MDDEDIIDAYTVSDDVCNTTISQLIGQLVEKGQMIAQN
jgi:predicted transcriptional regulator